MRISEEEIKNARQAIAKFVFNTKNISGRFIVFLAIAGMIIDAWDFSSISLVNFSFVNTFHPSAFILGLSAGTINIGAAIGAILGGYFTDRFGRRYMFIINMILFVIMAALSALATDVTEYILFRTILGFALGADVATGFSIYLNS
jgi:Arabinose efflux permease